jgi:soluble lytic murein transglycosylase-like protein
MRSATCAASSPPNSSSGSRAAWLPRLALAALTALTAPTLTTASPSANAQRDPELRAVLERAIGQAECFEDEFDSAVWYKMMEPRLRRRVPDKNERMLILKHVFCEAHRSGETRIPPGLLLAIIDVESAFNTWAVSHAGAVGLMQVMPFWPKELGMQRHQLVRVPENIKMGSAIFRHYLKRERGNVARALARYNGSLGKTWYSDMVINRWTRWNGADDLGLAPAHQAEVKSTKF